MFFLTIARENLFSEQNHHRKSQKAVRKVKNRETSNANKIPYSSQKHSIYQISNRSCQKKNKNQIRKLFFLPKPEEYPNS